MAKQKLKVAIVHDWLVGGGAELVVEQLHKMYPDAPIYTSYCTPEWRKRLDNKVVTGWLQHLGKIRKFIPLLRIWWFTHLKLDGYDLVISSSGAEAKGIKVNRKPRLSKRLLARGANENRKGNVHVGTLTADRSSQQSDNSRSSRVGSSADEQAAVRKTVHVNYCHAPTHYYWSRYDEYMQHPGFGAFDWLARFGLKLLVGPLRKWDYKAAQRPNYIVANSTHIQTEVKKYYGRDATVIFPPVYFERFQKPVNRDLPRKGFVISGRQTPYKRFDLAIEACTKLDLPLKVIGGGPDNARLRSLAGPSVEFLGRASDDELERVFAGSEALLFPGLDDFGITPVEAMAAGTPAIAYKAGGALDYVIEGKTGIFFTEQTRDSLIKALYEFGSYTFNHSDIQKSAEKFSAKTFTNAMVQFVNTKTKPQNN